MAFLIPVSVLGFAWLLFLPWRRRPELCLLAAVSGLMGLLYLAGLAGALKPAAVGLFWVGLVLVPLLAVYGQHRFPGLWVDFFSPGATLFFLLSLLFRLIWPDATLQLWDEFSHWAVASKEMLVTNALPGPQGALMFKEYPVGVNLLHYFAAVNSSDQESIYYLGHFLLLSAPLAVFLSPLSWRRPGWVLFSWAFSLLIIFTLSVFVCSLMVDVALGLYLGAGLLLAAQGDLKDRSTVLMAPVLMALPLIKASGYMFAWIIFAAMLMKGLGDFLHGRRDLPEQGILGGLGSDERGGRGGWPAMLALALVLIAPVAAQQSWNARVKALDLKQNFETQAITWQSVSRAFSPQASERHQTTRAAFYKALWDWPLSNYSSEPERSLARAISDHLSPFKVGPAGWLFICALLFAAACVRHRGRAPRRRVKLLIWLLAFFIPIYLLGLLLLYLFSFSEYEGPRLASFARYVNTLLMPMMLLALALALPDDSGREEEEPLHGGRAWAWWVMVGLALFMALAQAPSWSGILKWQARGDAAEERDYLAPMLEEVKQLVPASKRVFMVYQRSPGRGFHIARYEIAPRPTNKWFFSLGRPYYDGDVWTEPLTPAKLSEMLTTEGFDYFYLQRVDKQFADTYGALFATPEEPWNYRVFAVERGQGEGALVRLKPLGQAKPRGKQWWGPGEWE